MAWKISFSRIAEKQFKKLDKGIARKIKEYMEEKVLKSSHPKTFAKPLIHNKTGLWRYRVEDYRIICELKDDELVILVLQVDHRRKVYE